MNSLLRSANASPRSPMSSGLSSQRVEHAECRLADRAGELAAPDRIDDAAGVHGRPHVAVAAGAGDVEQAHALHEERPLLREEHRKALVDLDLERVAFDLAEVGIDGAVERDAGRDAELAADADVGVAVGSASTRSRSSRCLVHAVGHARQQLDQPARLQIREQQVRGPIEHPLAGQHLRPRIRHADAADLAEEHQAHPHLVAAREPQRLQRHLDLDDVAVGR